MPLFKFEYVLMENDVFGILFCFHFSDTSNEMNAFRKIIVYKFFFSYMKVEFVHSEHPNKSINYEMLR